MKSIFKITVCLLVFTVFTTLKSFSQTVYVQESGKKYHMKNCSVAGTGKTGMTIAEAKKAGYTACKVCKPDEAAAEKAKPAQAPKAADKPKEADKPKAAEPKKAAPANKPK